MAIARILIVANRTVGGAHLIEKVRERMAFPLPEPSDELAWMNDDDQALPPPSAALLQAHHLDDDGEPGHRRIRRLTQFCWKQYSATPEPREGRFP